MNIKRKRHHHQRSRVKKNAMKRLVATNGYYWRKAKPEDKIWFPPIGDALREELYGKCHSLSYLIDNNY